MRIGSEYQLMTKRKTSILRGILLGVVPLVLIVAGAAIYASGGRYVTSENAYVKADIIQISPEIEGRVSEVLVQENQKVFGGQVLFRLDPRPFKIALAEAKAELASVRHKIAAFRASYAEELSEIESAEERVRYLKLEVVRQGKLKTTGFAAGSKQEKAEHELSMAKRSVLSSRQRINKVVAELGGDPELPVEEHPLYLAALAKQERAELDLSRTEVRAPAAGRLSKVTLQGGEHIEAGNAVFALVKTGDFWVQVNIKEVKLTHLTVGQKATVVLDAYPNVTWDAEVESISPATGAEFSLLPAQNATGNWVKVVQRVPLRLKLVPRPSSPPLRAGMTASISIDTGHERNLSAIAADLLPK
ncbi:MAG: HlyD family secretion protein [Rhizobiales bacterium]|nr:HlyD family secretion protein [Hyphomicrobiales bacterium]